MSVVGWILTNEREWKLNVAAALTEFGGEEERERERERERNKKKEGWIEGKRETVEGGVSKGLLLCSL